MIGNINKEYIYKVFGDDVKFRITPGDQFDRITFIKSDKYKSADIVHARGSLFNVVENLVDYALIRVLNSTNENTNLHLSNVKRCINYIFVYGFAGQTKNERDNVIEVFGNFVEKYMTRDLANKIVTSWELADDFKMAFYEFFNTFDSFQMCKDFLKFFIDNLDNQKSFWDKVYTSIVIQGGSNIYSLHVCDLPKKLVSLVDYFYKVKRDDSNTIWNGTYYILVDSVSK